MEKKMLNTNLIFRGRIRHGRHFTFKALTGDATITFVAPSVSGSLVSDEKPFVAQGSWLQVLVPNSFLDSMESSLKFLNEPVMVNTFIILICNSNFNVYFIQKMLVDIYLYTITGAIAKNYQLARPKFNYNN